MLDSAVVWFGITIENALQERVKIKTGNEIEYRPVWTLARLLMPETKLPRPAQVAYRPDDVNVWAPLLAWAGKRNSGVKRYRYVPPEGEKTDG